MNTAEIMRMKGEDKITVLTCYDTNTAKILEEMGIDIILVGDSLGNVVLGYDTTQDVTMSDMIRHTGAVRRGAVSTFLVSDMPYQSDTSAELAVKNANDLIDVGADAVKVEGKPEICRALVQHGIAVMGHIGHLPQTAEKPMVHKEKERLMKEAKDLEEAGCFAIVLEMVQSEIASDITFILKIPTIGIGAGSDCDGQVLVVNDILGMFEDFKPRFVKRYTKINEEIRKAVSQYKKEVKNGEFPGEENSFK